jgi:subtilisin-like proprotein convertase family protein
MAGVVCADSATRRALSASGVRLAGGPPAVEGLLCPQIPDDAYDGSLASMTCVDVPGIDANVEHVKLYLGLRHRWAGDLTVKVVDPSQRVVTVMSRPGMSETADDGDGCCGAAAGLTQTLPVSYADDATGASAETLGAGLRDAQVACRDDGHCEFVPSAGAATPGSLATFNGANGAGTWKVCVGDGESLETGNLCSAVLAFNRLEADLAVTAAFPTGTMAHDPYTLAIDVVNHGPSPQADVVVANVLSSELVYVSDDCGGSYGADGWQWQAGALDVDAHARCNISVRMAQSGSCRAVTATTRVSGGVADPRPDDNVAFAQEGNVNRIADPSLETSGFAGGGAWASTSTNFGHVFCAVGRCSDAPSLNAWDGDWFAWFGGVDPAYPGDATLPESGTLSQTIAIPAGASTLGFRVRAPSCSGSDADFLSLTIDGVERWRIDATDGELCGAGYALQTVGLADVADGAHHVVAFHGVQAQAGGATSFFVDSVELVEPVECGRGDDLFQNGFDVAAPTP